MSADMLLALIAFALVSSITPGPNNMMLMASGANFGLSRTVPHLMGVGIGFTLMVALVGLGVIQLFDRFPLSYTLLRYFSMVYLLYLAWRIATAGTPQAQASGRSRPITFLQAALFQWVNPKTWTMALTAISLYAPAREPGAVLWVALAFGLVNLPSVSAWVLLGQQMQKILTSTRRLRLFNGLMATLLVASLIPAVIG